MLPKTGYFQSFNYLFSLTNKSTKELEKQFKGKGYGRFKKSLAKVLIDYLEPFRRKQKELQTRDVM